MEITSAEEAIASVSAGLDWFAQNHPSLFCDGNSVEALEREGSRFECAMARAVNSFDQWGEWARDGATTATAWIDTTCHLPKKEVRAQLRRGKALATMPLVAQAWMNGDIGAAHVDALIRVKRPVTEEALSRDEEILVDVARTLKFAEFATVVDSWEHYADQDGTDEAAEAKRTQRDVYLYPSPGGYLGEMRFDTIGGAIVSKELKRIEEELFEADRAEAKERLGRDPRHDELARTPAQRRADAMIEMAVRSAAANVVEGRRPEPLFSVLVGYPTLFGRISQLEQGPVVAPGSLLWWLETAGYDFEILTDHDLHAEGVAALQPYRSVINCTHPEYYSEAMLDATEDYLSSGGRLIYAGGNGYYWVTSLRDSEPHCIEVRKLDVMTVVDTDGEPLRQAVRAEPDVVSPNMLEAEELVGHEFAKHMGHSKCLVHQLGSRQGLTRLSGVPHREEEINDTQYRREPFG